MAAFARLFAVERSKLVALFCLQMLVSAAVPTAGSHDPRCVLPADGNRSKVDLNRLSSLTDYRVASQAGGGCCWCQHQRAPTPRKTRLLSESQP